MNHSPLELPYSLSFFQAMINHQPDAVLLINEQGKLVYANQAITEILGYTLDEFMSFERCQIVHPDDYAHCIGLVDQLMQNPQKPLRAQVRVRHKNGTWRWIEEISQNLLDEPDVKALMVNFHDVTDRVMVEQALQEQAAALRESSFALEASSAALRGSEERYHLLFEHSPIMIWVEDFRAVKHCLDELVAAGVEDWQAYFSMNPGEIKTMAKQVKVVDVNQRTVEFMGISKKEDFAQNLGSFFPQESAAVFQQELIALANGETSFQGQEPVITARGERKTLELAVSVEPGYENSLERVLVSCFDITESKKFEQQMQETLHEKEALVKEVHHRVKNNLQIIASLLDLQSDAVRDSLVIEALQDSRSRVRAMALVHQKLYQSSNMAQVNAAEYLEELLDGLSGIYQAGANARLEMKIEAIPLDLDTAISCGMVTSELVSNAMKHAFPGDRSGTITVSLSPLDAALVLTVQDDGIGLPESLNLDAPSTLGLQLVSVLTRQLRGTLKITSQTGTKFEISFPFGR